MKQIIVVLFTLINLAACESCIAKKEGSSVSQPKGEVPADSKHLKFMGEYEPISEESKRKKMMQSPVVQKRLQTIASRASEFPLSAFDPVKTQGRYLAHCARCHGNQGLGDGPEESRLAIAPTNLKEWDFKFGTSIEDIVYTITYGRSEKEMPAFRKQLKLREIWSLARLVESWRKEKMNDKTQNSGAME